MRFSADTAYRVEKSFLRFGLRGCYVVDLHGRMNSCRLVILKKLKKFENYFNKRCGGFKGICDKIEIIHNKMLKN